MAMSLLSKITKKNSNLASSQSLSSSISALEVSVKVHSPSLQLEQISIDS
jgi:hypothetical protein